MNRPTLATENAQAVGVDHNSALRALHPPLRILGVDPGLNITGYAVLEGATRDPKVVEAGVVRGKTKSSLAARLAEIHDGLADVIASLRPTAMALEQLYSHYAHPRTSILMGHARGVICLAAAKAEIEVINYSATQIKKVLTGNGRAPKTQMQAAVRRELRLTKTPEPADVADALAIALCHFYLGARRNNEAALAKTRMTKRE
jgi:crossover junction endodeoxyribonuclease RuvC